MERRNFLKGVLGGAAVTLSPKVAGDIILQPEKELILPTKVDAIVQLDETLPPFGVTSWTHDGIGVGMIDSEHRYSKQPLVTRTAKQPTTIKIWGEIHEATNGNHLRDLFESNALVSWRLPSHGGVEVLVTGRIATFSITANVSEFVKSYIVLLPNKPIEYINV